MKHITFWNGNKSAARQTYETEVLRQSLDVHKTSLTNYTINIDNTDYPVAEDESNIFLNGCDVLVTVAGNQKFANRDKLIIESPICNGLLGHRLLIINKHAQVKFKQISNLQQLRKSTIGIPATWADADLFRKNQCKVHEKGLLEDVLNYVHSNQVDYATLGANEITTTLKQYTIVMPELVIENTLLIYYPLPLLFYVNANQPALAHQLQLGLNELINNGTLQDIFNRYHSEVVKKLNLPMRNKITLNNPYLPANLRNFCPQL